MWKHTRPILAGIKGTTSYIAEELDELKDADAQGNLAWSAIEAADVLIAVGKYSHCRLRCPFLLIVLLGYIRWAYKPVRNLVLDAIGVKKP